MPTVYLDPFEEITSVIEHLRNAKEKDVVLFIPEGAVIFQSVINLKLLKDEAVKLGKNLSLVTADEHGKSVIGQAGMEPVKKDVDPEEFLGIEENKENEKDDENIEDGKGNEAKNEDEGIKDAEEAVAEENIKTAEDSGDKNYDSTLTSDSHTIPFSRLAASFVKKQKFAKSVSPTPKKMVDIVPRKSLGGIFDSGQANITPKIKKVFSKKTKNIFEQIPKAIEKSHEGLEAIYKVKSSIFSKFSGFSGILFWIFIGVSFLAGILAVTKVLPRVGITINPVIENFSKDISITAEESAVKIDFENKIIPGQKLEVLDESSKDFPATGEKEIREKARGIISVYNEWSSQSQTLVTNTRFTSESGKLFRTTKVIVVPGASIAEGKSIPGTIDIEVAADQPGEDYNIGPSRFDIPGFKGSVKYMTIYGKSKIPMSGGAIGKFKVVSDEDYNKASDLLKEELSNKVMENLNKMLPSSFVLPKDAVKEEVLNINSTTEKGARAENFTLSMKIAASSVVFNSEDVKELALNIINSNITQDKIIVPDSLNISYKNVEFNKDKLNMNINVSSKFSPKINIEKIKKELLRKDEKGIRDYLSSQNEISSAKVSFWPFWVKKVPNNAGRVNVKIEYKV